MEEKKKPVNTSDTTAPLTNVRLCMQALDRAMNRRRHLPGLVCLYGPAGWGKSRAATYAYNRLAAYYVECCDTFTRKAFIGEILQEMGVAPAKTLHAMFIQAVEVLAEGDTPLIIDDMDKLIQKAGIAEIIKDLFERGQAPILLIGEENLPYTIEKWERLHSRVLQWVPAQPVTLEDTVHLHRLFYRETEIEDALLVKLYEASAPSARRAVVNLDMVAEQARAEGRNSMTLAQWGNRKFEIGKSPKRRRVSCR